MPTDTYSEADTSISVARPGPVTGEVGPIPVEEEPTQEGRWARAARWLVSPGVVMGEIGLVVLMLVVSFDAFQRYLISGSVTGLPNLASELLLPICILLPLAYATRNGSHVRVGIIYENLPPVVRAVVDRFGDALAMTLWGFVAISMARSSFSHMGLRSMTGHEVPTSWSHGVIGLGAALMCVVSLVLVIAGPRARRREDPDELAI